MKKGFLAATIALMVLTAPFNAHAQDLDTKENQKDIEIMRGYIQSNVSNLTEEFEKLENDVVTLDQVENVISNYYKKHPLPDAGNNPNINLEKVFPEKSLKFKEKTEKKLVINNLVDTQKKDSEDGQVISLTEKNGNIDILLADTGEMLVVERKVVEKEPKTTFITNKITRKALPDEYTRLERTTGIAYNASGNKLFYVWAEGQFKYNGTTVSPSYKDGDYGRYAAGSTINLEERARGKSRTVVVEDQKYSEVYTDVYFESVIGIRWVGLVLKSGTVEAYVGASKYGNMYGGTKTK